MVAFPYLNIQSNQRQARSSWSSKSQRIGETKSVGLTPVRGQTSSFFKDKVNIIKMSPVCQLLVGKAQKAKTSDGPNISFIGGSISQNAELKHTPTNTSNETYFSGSCC